MPCRDDWGPPSREEHERAFEHNSTLAETFCATMYTIEKLGNLNGALEQRPLLEMMPSKARQWWEEHKKRDKARIEQQVAQQKRYDDREAALSKLSTYEKNLLGIKS